jgi:hypothetical protein
MIREEIREDAELHFIGKTDAQILRELFGGRIRRPVALPDEQSEHQSKVAPALDRETGSQTH